MYRPVHILGLAIGVPLVGLLAASAAGQSILYVDDDASTNGNGLTWETAYKYLQDALWDAGGDPDITEIRVAGGFYRPDQDEAGWVTPGDTWASFSLYSGVALRGGHAGWADLGNSDARDLDLYKTILTGDLAGDDGPDFTGYDDNSWSVVTAGGIDSTAVLDGVTVTAAQDGGMYNSGGGPTVLNCTFSKNWGFFGAGMCNYSSNPALVNCRFFGNWANYGGGMCNFSSSPVLANCLFSGNIAYAFS